MTERTTVWLDGIAVAELETRSGVDLRLRYTAESMERWPALSPVLSCSLPLTRRRQDALAFGEGVLPEGQALASMASDAKVAVNATFALLRRYGRDVAGALVVADERPGIRPGAAVPYAAGALDAAVSGLDQHPLDLQDDSELSIAGFQDKLLLIRTDDGWARPAGGRPSTHILKRDNLRHRGIVVAEAAALRIAAAVGITTITPQVVELGGFPCLIVDRFDRAVDARGGVRRIHQEDLCQATGTSPTAQRGRAKYEDHGGPGFVRLAELLNAYGADPVRELEQLVRVLTFTVLIGNGDAHAKNLALLHPTAETVALAPVYDPVPTALWPGLADRAAMHVGGRRRLSEVTLDDIHREVRRWPIAAARAAAVVAETIDGVADAAGDCGHDGLAAFVRTRAAALRG
jgi:serine/threonine-protein kinase HipA